MSTHCTRLRGGQPCGNVVKGWENSDVCFEMHDDDRRSLIAFTETHTPDEELAAQAMEPRPGVGMHRSMVTFRKLDQHETDCLIALELQEVIVRDEVDAFIQLWGGPDGRDLDVIHVVSRNALREAGPKIWADSWLFKRQRGGIHSDPLIRIIAFRAWKRRDIDWTPPVARPRFDPPMHNIPATRKTKPGKPTGRRFSHQNGCSDPNCDGQCVER